MNASKTKPSPRRVKNDKTTEVSGAALRLLAAVLLFAVCFVAKTRFPDQSQRWRSQLSQLIGSQTDLDQAFTRLGEELERQETVVRAVGDWCVSVFGPENVTIHGRPESSVPASAALEETGAVSAASEGAADASGAAEGAP